MHALSGTADAWNVASKERHKAGDHCRRSGTCKCLPSSACALGGKDARADFLLILFPILVLDTKEDSEILRASVCFVP